MTFRYRATNDVTAVIAKLVADEVPSRLASADVGLWGDDVEFEAAIRLAWLNSSETSRPLLAEIDALRAELREDGVDRVLLAGTAGSALAAEVICAASQVALVNLDSAGPTEIRTALGGDLARTILVVSSKSGDSLQTDAVRRIYEQALHEADIDHRARIVVVTDPDSPLHALATEKQYRNVFLAEPHLSDPYSSLSAFALVPAGLAGADIGGLLDDAAAIGATLAINDASNPAVALAAVLAAGSGAHADKLVIAEQNTVNTGFGRWVEQLITAATAKNDTAILPVVVESDQAIGYRDAGQDAIKVLIGEDDLPNGGSSFALSCDGLLGTQFLLWEYASAMLARLLRGNPFDQPDLGQGEDRVRTILADADDPEAALASEARVEIFAPGSWLREVTDVRGAIDALVARLPTHGYVAVMAYLDRTADTSATDVRAAIAAKTAVQATFDWSPRCLSSGGQFHHGGRQHGVFLQITAASDQELSIPGHDYSLGELQLAQATGDGAALAGGDRPVLRLHLTDRSQGLSTIMKALDVPH